MNEHSIWKRAAAAMETDHISGAEWAMMDERVRQSVLMAWTMQRRTKSSPPQTERPTFQPRGNWRLLAVAVAVAALACGGYEWGHPGALAQRWRESTSWFTGGGR